ncbi:MAG: indole-3-glycerol phosphate synthase TrpC [Candidatus Helarchaeales archaeon]
MNILFEIAEKRKIHLNEIKKKYSIAKSRPKERDCFQKSLRSNENVSIISEIKAASPSKGALRELEPLDYIAAEMERGGAAGISVLTEPDYFHGSPDFISIVKKSTKLPILMKDFFIDECQLFQAADLGANMILLIASLLKEREITRFLEICDDLNLEALVEVHDEKDLEKIRNLNLNIVGINNRNLKNLSINLSNTKRLAPLIRKKHANALIISESGIKSRKDVEFVASAGIDAVLVGSAVMSSRDIAGKIQELRGTS